MGLISDAHDIQCSVGDGRRSMRNVASNGYVMASEVFATVDGYQEHLYLKDRVWIDETYIFDSTLLHDDNFKQKRGLSKNLICIVVANDIHKNTAMP